MASAMDLLCLVLFSVCSFHWALSEDSCTRLNAIDLVNTALDTQLSSSGSHSYDHTLSRLSSTSGWWYRTAWPSNNWIQLSLSSESYTTIYRIVTKGHGVYGNWVNEYNIQYSNDGINFITYKDNGLPKVFVGNSDSNTEVSHELDPPISARFIRLIPVTVYRYIGVRWGVFGCTDLAAGDGTFDCRRSNTGCYNGGVCNWKDNNVGKCSCQTNYLGFDCSVPNSQVIPKSSCDEPCDEDNTFQCVQTNNVSTCSCNYLYTGPTCADNRVRIVCTETTMQLTISPYAGQGKNFSGAVYVPDQPNAPCAYETLDGVDFSSWTMQFSECSILEIKSDDSIIYQLGVYVRYHPLVLTSHDEVITGICMVKTMGDLVAGGDPTVIGDFEVNDPPHSIDEGSIVIDDTAVPVTMKITDLDGNLITDVVNIGDKMRIQFIHLFPNSGSRFIVESCSAFPSTAFDATNEFALIQDRCVVPDAFYIMSMADPEPIETDGEDKILNIEAFKIDGTSSDTVVVKCNVRVCMDSADPVCNDKIDCTAPITKGLRKRQVSIDEEVTASRNITFTISDPNVSHGSHIVVNWTGFVLLLASTIMTAIP